MKNTINYACYPFSHFIKDLHVVPRIVYGFQGAKIQESLVLDNHKYLLKQLVRNTSNSDLSCVIYMEGEHYEIRMESSDAMNDRNTLINVAEAIKVCTQEILQHPDALISEIKIVNEQEQQALIDLGKGEELVYDTNETFVDLFKKQAVLHPSYTAVVDETNSITYAELDKATNALASELVSKGVTKDSFVCIMLPRRKEFLISTLAAFKAGGAYVPLDADYPNDRLLYMLEDSKAKVLITTTDLLDEKRKAGDFDAENILLIDEFDFNRQCTAINNSKPASLAYMIYTSGSTGKPKGVMIEHKALVSLIKWFSILAGLKEKEGCVAHPSFSFDASIIDLTTPLAVGATVHILPASLRQDMQGMYQYLNDNHIVGLTLSTQLGMEMLNAFDLNIRYLIMGGEKLKPTRPSNVMIINGYGPTEFTVCSSYHIVDQTKEYQNIPIGKAVPNSISVIVDSNGNLLPQGIAGELCLIGRQMARGYWNREELTEEKFADCPFLPGEKMYHTGDLVRWDEEGELEYLGRIDNQVKLRGFRIELGEIESAVSKYEGITGSAVEVKEINGVQHLCAYYTADVEIDKDKLKEYLSQSLTEYMVPDAYLQLEAMPLTPNGKINRKTLPVPEMKAEEIVAPETAPEKALFEVVAEQLKTTDFGVTTNLMSMGLTSLGAIKLSVSIQRKLGLELKTKDILQHPTIRAWVNLMDAEQETMKSYPKQDYYPLTENQLGVYIDWEQHRESLQYNVPIAMKLKGVDAEILKTAIETVIAAHPYLKVHFEMRNENIVQVRRDEEPFNVVVTEIDNEPHSTFFQSRVRPFNLLSDDLCRIEIYTFEKNVYLFIDIHHTIYDGGSMSLLLHDIITTYNGKKISSENFTAYDYALYYNEWKKSEGYSESEKYFDKLLDRVESIQYPLSVKTDGFEFSHSISVSMPRKGVTELSRRLSVTENSVFMTAFTQLLHRITREENLAITTISNGRSSSVMSNTIGMFVQTLPLVSRNQKVTVADAVRAMQQQLLGTLEHDKYPFTKVVERYGIRPDIMVVYQGDVIEENMSFGNTAIENIKVELSTVKTPLSLNIVPSNDTVELLFEYDGSKYATTDIQQLANALKTLTEEMTVSQADIEITTIGLLSPTTQQALIALGKGEELVYDTNETFVDLFKKQAVLHPSYTAVVDEADSITYAELDKATNALASELVSKGVTKESFVCIMLPRRKEFLISTLAVFKAGGAYVPLDADYPNDRLLYMLEDSKAKVLITTTDLLDEKRKAGDFDAENIILIDEFDFNRQCTAINNSKPASLAYMIYTSGSTGKPKGVMVEHKNLLAFVKWITRMLELTDKDAIAQHVSFSFDASLNDLMPPLTVGATVHILPSSMRQDMIMMNSYFNENHITGTSLSTQLGMEMLNGCDLKLRYLMVGGEKLKPTRPSTVSVINCYGPTEFTVCSSYHIVDQTKEYQNIPIGKAVPNSISVIVDNNGNLLPQGVAGELCLIGRQMTRGYWKREELTKEKFADCPFLPDEKMYHTGDLVRWDEGGELEYLGRIDNQVKLRGFRIELGEIENAISKYESITGSAVEVKEINGVQHLCAYFTAEVEIDKDKLKEYLSQSLTEYMVPDAYLQLEAMPLTPNGKINRKALPVIAVESNIKYEAPTNEVEQTVCNVFAEILSLEKVGINHDFFQIGGTSLLAIKAIVRLSNAGYKLVYGDLFKLKTPVAIAKFFMEQKSDSTPKANPMFDFSNYDYSKIETVLQKNHDVWSNFSLTPTKRALVVGTTGFLGIHLLHHLLMTQDCEIICLVRAKKDFLPLEKLKSLMVYYFGDEWEEKLNHRVTVINGDLKDARFIDLLKNEKFDTVFNCAAIVKHYVADSKDMEAVNVEGVVKLISLCEEKGAKLIHISTVSIAGCIEKDTQKCLDEHKFYLGQKTDNQYLRTKFLAERYILQAVADGRIHAKIMRVGNLMGRECDGEFQINLHGNAFANSLKSMKVLGCTTLDSMMSPVEFSPIDRVAEAICLLAQTPDDWVVFHPYNNYAVNMAIMVKAFNDYGYKIEITSQSAWAERWEQLMHDNTKAEYLQGLLHYQQDDSAVAGIPFENDYTTKVLYKLGFYWTPAHEGYMIKLITMLDGLGFFDE